MKTMIKHTKGPWNKEAIYRLLRYAGKNDLHWNDGFSEDDSLNIPCHYDGDPEVIAAAPTMYKNLHNIYELLNGDKSNSHELLVKISQLAEAGLNAVEPIE